MKKILHVGCGPTPLPAGFPPSEWSEIRFDISPDCNPDIIGNVTDLSAFPACEFDAIFSSHNIEHLYVHDMLQSLKEFRRVLRPEGHLYIICPDLQTLGRYISEGDLHKPLYTSPAGDVRVSDLLWGFSGHVAAGMEYMAHKYGFTAHTLANWLAAAGFKHRLIARRLSQFELCAIASPGEK